MSNNFSSSFLFTMLALALVLVLAWIILRGLSRMSISKSRNGRIEVLESVPMGSRERLVLVRFDDSEILLGVTANNIRRVDPGRIDPGRIDPGRMDAGTIDPGTIDPGKTAL